MHVKMMCTSFLPLDEVTVGFEAVQEMPDYDPRLNVILDCFEDNNVGWVLHTRNHHAPLFPINIWNSYIRLEEGAPRTNKAMEG